MPDFFFEGARVLEEIFPSKSYFEYVVQHRSDLLDALYVIHIEMSRTNTVDPVKVFRAAPAEVSALCSLWDHQYRIDAIIEGRGKLFPDSPEEAETIARAGLSGAPSFNQFENLRSSILRIAEARFLHLGKVRAPRL